MENLDGLWKFVTGLQKWQINNSVCFISDELLYVHKKRKEIL